MCCSFHARILPKGPTNSKRKKNVILAKERRGEVTRENKKVKGWMMAVFPLKSDSRVSLFYKLQNHQRIVEILKETKINWKAIKHQKDIQGLAYPVKSTLNRIPEIKLRVSWSAFFVFLKSLNRSWSSFCSWNLGELRNLAKTSGLSPCSFKKQMMPLHFGL